LPGVDPAVAAALAENGVEYIEDFLALSEGQPSELQGITADQLKVLQGLIDENVEIVEEDVQAEAPANEEPVEGEGEESDEDTEEYECPECGAKITTDMTTCPNCGIGLSFEYEDEE